MSTPDQPSRPERRDRAGVPLASRVLERGARGARGIAGATGVNQALDAAVEESIVQAMESPAVERALLRLAEDGKLAKVIEEAVARTEIEELVGRALDSDASDRIWADILASDKAQKLVERVAEAPEVRAAIAQQGFGLISDVGRSVSKITERFDDLFERVAHRIVRRPGHEGETNQVGLVTRLVAMGLDLALMFGALSVVSGLLASILPVALGDSGKGFSTLGLALLFVAAIAAIGSYLVTFWSLAGQTPGMRFLGIRLQTGGSNEIGLRRALKRLFAIPLSILPLLAGYLVILIRANRRSFHDQIAGTDMIYDESSAPWSAKPRDWAHGDEPSSEPAAD